MSGALSYVFAGREDFDCDLVPIASLQALKDVIRDATLDQVTMRALTGYLDTKDQNGLDRRGA